MAIIGLQGLRGGVGTTSVTTGLAWALQQLEESVLVIDCSPDNMLRLFFNVEFTRPGGWARALLDKSEWAETAWRYTSHLDILPFGQLSREEQQQLVSQPGYAQAAGQMIDSLVSQNAWRWILLDLPASETPFTEALTARVNHHLVVVNPEMNCHVRLHQQAVPSGSHILVNNLLVASQIQDDIWQMWLKSQLALVPMVLHRDEAMGETLGAKQPVGEYRQEALITEELNTLANWCLLNFAGSA